MQDHTVVSATLPHTQPHSISDRARTLFHLTDEDTEAWIQRPTSLNSSMSNLLWLSQAA